MDDSAMRVLIIGASGFIGNILLDDFSKQHKSLGTFYNHSMNGLIHLDVKNIDSIRNVTNYFDPDVILLLAANPNVEYCEEHPKETWQVNIKGTENVAKIVYDIGAKLVYFSSEYVFDGKTGPYSEEDKPNPINVYGQQKLESERIIQKIHDNYLIIRVTVVYGWERQGKNFLMRMIKTLKNGKSMKVPYDQIGSPTYANNMTKAVKELVQKEKKGVYHIVGSDIIDRYSFAKTAAEFFSLNSELLIPLSTEDLNQRARRPLKAGLKIDKAIRDLDTKLVGINEGLKMMKKDLIRKGDLM